MAREEICKLGSVELVGTADPKSRSSAVKALQKEACGVGANLIFLVNEFIPEVKGDRYTCSAEFYQSIEVNKVIVDQRVREYQSRCHGGSEHQITSETLYHLGRVAMGMFGLSVLINVL